MADEAPAAKKARMDEKSERRAAAIAKARINLHKLLALMEAPLAELKDRARAAGGTLAKALGVPDDAIAPRKSKNVKASLLGIVMLFREHPYLARGKIEVAEYLLNLEVICSKCFRIGERGGVLMCVPTTISAHMRRHTTEAGGGGGGGGLQMDLREAGFEFKSTEQSRMDALMVATGALIAGGGGAAALPYSSIRKTFSPDVRTVMDGMRDGFPDPKKMREKVMPRVVSTLKKEHLAILKGMDFSLGIDGGSSELVNGMKMLPIIALSPELPLDLTVEVFMLPMHENSEIQAGLINKYFEETGLPKSRLKFLAVDNNQVNIKSVDILNETFGFNVQVARCIDHSLNLVFVAFLNPFEVAFSLQKLLRNVRSYIKAGGGQSRRAALVEHALSLSGIDFTATRWTSFLRAVLYVMGEQTDYELKRAREALTELAEWGDKSAAAALLEEDVRRSRWTQLHDALQSMGADAEEVSKKKRRKSAGASEIKEVKLDELLVSFNDIEMFCAFFVVSKMFARVPALFTVLQGDERFAPMLSGLSKAEEGKGRLDVVAAARAVVSDLAELADKENPLRGVLLSQAREACVARIEAALEAARKDNEPLLEGKEAFNEEDVDEYMDNAKKFVESALVKIEKVIKQGAKEFKACAGMAKVEEALGDMEFKVKFGLNNGAEKPPPFAKAAEGQPAYSTKDASKPVLDFFGVPNSERGPTDADLARKLVAEWQVHSDFMHSTEIGFQTPARAMLYWRQAQNQLPALSKLALLRLVRPNGNAAPERFMSVLKDMDRVTARSMKKNTLYNVAMIRGNWALMRVLLRREAQLILARKERAHAPAAASAAAQAAASKRMRLDDALRHATEAALPEWAQKGKEEEEEEEEEKEEEEEEGEEEE